MSFLRDADCSTSGYPLNQLAKHAQEDKSLQGDRFIGSHKVEESFRSQRGLLVRDEALAAFLQQNGEISQDKSPHFGMQAMLQDLDGYQVAPKPSAKALKLNYHHPMHIQEPGQVSTAGGQAPVQFDPSELHQAQEMGTKLAPTASSSFDQIFSYSKMSRRPMGVSFQGLSELNYQGILGSSYQGPLGMNYGIDISSIGLPYAPISGPRQSKQSTASKGKERMVELDDKQWEEQFAEIDRAAQFDLDAEANQAMEMELNEMDKTILSETNKLLGSDSNWRDTEAEIGIFDYDRLDFDVNHLPSLGEYDRWNGSGNFYPDSEIGTYLFEQENPFNTVADPYNEGLKIMREGGNLSLAALAFEAAVQQNPQHIEAWSMLGGAQAQNEKETPAIRAFEQALKIDSSNLSALMGLAISYTNENYDTKAYRTLERWLSVKYPQIISPENLFPDSEIGFSERHLLHERVTGYFIRAAQLSPKGEHMDPDVQVGLGVLFYGAEEHEKAVDCFEAALSSHESGSSNQPGQIHLLWNRLGATLANSGRSEEAIAAYTKALTINPNFVRARYNLGVSCINIGCFEEAAQHLLSALSLHRVVEREGIARVKEVIGGTAVGGNGQSLGDADMERLVGMNEATNQSTNLMETLRRVFGSMGRRDLAEKVQVGMDVDSFRGEFDF